MKEFQEKINELKKELKNEIDEAKKGKGVGTEVDDLFILRFLLSNESMDEVIENIKFTLKWRKENIDKILEIVEKGPNGIPYHHVFTRFQVTGWAGTMSGNPIFVVRTGLGDPKGTLKALTIDECVEHLIFSNEVGFQKIDKNTRKYGKFCKTIAVIDMDGFSIFKGDKNFFKALGDSSKLSEKVYPQLNGAGVLINTPATLRIIMRAFKTFQSKRSLEKQKICPVTNSKTKDANECPFLTKYKGVDQVPPFLGNR